MELFDFKIEEYFKSNKHLISMVNYYRKSLNISKKDLQKENNISHATYRRAEVSDFVAHVDILKKLATYFDVEVEVDNEVIEELNNNFNLLYTFLYLNDVPKMEDYYNRIDEKKHLYSNNVLFTIYHFARLVYYVGSHKRVEVEIISESLDILRYFRGDLLEIFEFLLDDYTYCYYSLIHDEENALKFQKKVYLKMHKYTELVPQILHQMSLNNYLINDYANSIFYAFEALPKLEADLNYSKALYCNLNIAICFERLNNTIKSKEILTKLSLTLMSQNIPRAEYLAKLTLANCYVTEKNYPFAINLLDELESRREIKGENSLLLVYCYYKDGDMVSFNKVVSELKQDFLNDRFNSGYYDMLLLIESITTKKKTEILELFKIASESFQFYGDAKIVDLIFKEMQIKKLISTTTKREKLI